ncbi:hypothetical protein Trydic_g19913 [Trypoxylus dichotomus]
MIAQTKMIPASCTIKNLNESLNIWEQLENNQWIYVLSNPIRLTVSCNSSEIHNTELKGIGIVDHDKNCKGYTEMNQLIPNSNVITYYHSIIPQVDIVDDCCELINDTTKLEMRLQPITLTNLHLQDLGVADHKLKQLDKSVNKLFEKPRTEAPATATAMAARAGPSTKNRTVPKKAANTTTTPFNDDALGRLKEAVANASEDSSDMEFDDDIETDTTVTNTSSDESTADDFRPPSRRQQRKRKGSCNSGTDGESKKRPVANTNPEGTSAVPKKEGRIPPVVLRDKARWMRVNAEIQQLGVNIVKVVNAQVGIRIQPATASDYRRLVEIVTNMKVPFHSYQLTEEKPLKIVLRGLPEEIQEDLAQQGFATATVKRMTVGPNKRPIPLVFVQLSKSDQSKKIFDIRQVCGLYVRVESKQIKKNTVTQCHRCQLYGHGQRNCHAAAVCVKCAGPHQTAECSKPREAPAKCALCKGPHTANYGGCPKAPRPNQVPARPNPPARNATRSRQAERRPVTAVAPPKPTQGMTMEVDVPQPSTSNAKPSYAAAVKNAAATPVRRTVVAKRTAEKSPKTVKTQRKAAPKKNKPQVAERKPAPAKPVVPKTSATPKQTTGKKTAVKSVPRPATNSDTTNTFATLISLLRKINWAKLLNVASVILPQLLECSSGAQAGVVLASHLQDILAIFSNE